MSTADTADNYPLVNGTPIGAQARRLVDNDVIQLAGVKMGFFEELSHGRAFAQASSSGTRWLTPHSSS